MFCDQAGESVPVIVDTLLEFLRQDRVSPLDGGLAGWMTAGRGVQSGVVAPPATVNPSRVTMAYCPICKTWAQQGLGEHLQLAAHGRA